MKSYVMFLIVFNAPLLLMSLSQDFLYTDTKDDSITEHQTSDKEDSMMCSQYIAVIFFK